MPVKAVAKKRVSPKGSRTGKGKRLQGTLDQRRWQQLEQMMDVFGTDVSSAVSDCIARRHIELKKEYPNEFD
jgi:hypothetical protein